ncbi:MAG: Rossmann-like and DUF2520 domain-containing protein [Pyrinomonadaceae bacterium]
MKSVSIIGVGRLGGALAIALARKKYNIENLFFKNKSKTDISQFINSQPVKLFENEYSQIASETIFITTRDSEIEKVADHLAKKLRCLPFIFHTSGSLSSKNLKVLKAIGCKVGSVHPLASISDAVSGAEHFAGAYFCVEGDPEAVLAAEKLVRDLGGKSFSIETKYKALYHASAVTACGHLVALIDVAIEMLTKCGLKEAHAQEILMPLVKSTIENLNTQKPSEALTGTFARADVETFENHLQIMKKTVSKDVLEVYLQLGFRSLHLAGEQGADEKNIAKMQNKILLAKKISSVKIKLNVNQEIT